jgi:formylmethanofuran dehydrogenase subunit E
MKIKFVEAKCERCKTENKGLFMVRRKFTTNQELVCSKCAVLGKLYQGDVKILK